MQLEHHCLDRYPMPKDKAPLFVNEPWLADKYAYELQGQKIEIGKDNIRVYVPLDLNKTETLIRTLRFIARLQCEWWLPYHAIVNRLHEEGYIDDNFYMQLFKIDDRNPESSYCRIFKTLDPEKYTLLNSCTCRKGVSNVALETILLNYEDGEVSEDEFVELLSLFGKSPEDLGYDLYASPEALADLSELFEGGEQDEC